MPKKIPEFGVEIVAGLPGSGKSLMCVRRCVEAVERDRRPVYTNLPLKWQVVRAYLANRGGPNVASLIRPLSKEFFDGFLARYALFASSLERWRAEARAKGEPITTPELNRRWVALAGPDIIEGEKANWIPPGSVVCLDEFHTWYAMQDQAKETRALQTYLSQHRHMVHAVWVVTQDPGMVSVSVRRLATKFWQVRDMRNDKLLWGVRFRHIGLHAIGYCCFTGDQINSRSLDDQTPLANYVTFPWLPSNSRFFRFYSGFAHAGKVSALVRQMEATRKASGLSADGRDVADERVLRHRERERVRRSNMVKRVVRIVRWCALRGLGVGVVAVIAFAAGRMGGGGETEASRGNVASATAEGPGPTEGDSGGTVAATVNWPRWEGAGRDHVRIGGQRVGVGQTVGPGVLRHIATKPRVLVITVGRDVWLWRWGEPKPRRVGDIDQVRGVIEGRTAAKIRSDLAEYVARNTGG